MPSMQDGSHHSITVQMLRPFAVWVDGRPMGEASWRLRHARQLFQMLCLRPGQRLHRDEAIERLWPQSGAPASVNRLYHTLHVLRTEFAKSGLEAAEPVVLFQAGALWLNPCHEFTVDLWTLEAWIGQSRQTDATEVLDDRLEQAAALFDQPLPPTGPHDAWFEPHRREIHGQCVGLLERLAERHRARGRQAQATQVLQRLVGFEPCNEVAHRALMALFDAAGQSDRALLQYAACARGLWRDLGVQPAPATQSLHAEILARSQSRSTPAPANREPAPSPHYVPPAPHCVQFLGRADELAELQARLGESRCRLITIAAPAGTGKTSLALALANAVQHQFRNGVLVVRLTQLGDAAALEQCICDGAGVPVGQADAALALRKHLRDQDLLLVLDRFEHLVDAAARVSALIEAAPGLRVLVTSQCVLGCQAERVFELRQLAQSAPAAARALFVETARRAGARSDQLADASRIAQLCERLGGNALAIQLGAAQLGTVSIEQLEAGVASLLDLPPVAALDDEPQHRSLHAAISWSVSLLDAPYRSVLMGLAVFEGAFNLDDAHAVLDAVFGARHARQCLLLLMERHLIVRQAAPLRAATSSQLVLPDAIRLWLLAWVNVFAEWHAVKAAHAQLYRQRTAQAFQMMRAGRSADALAMYGPAERNIELAQEWQAAQGERATQLQWCAEVCSLRLTNGDLVGATNRLRRAVAAPAVSSDEQHHSAWCCYLLSRGLRWLDDLPGSVLALRWARQRSVGIDNEMLTERIGLHFSALRSTQLHLRTADRHLQAVIARSPAQQASPMAWYQTSVMRALQGDYGLAAQAAEHVFDAALQANNTHLTLSALQMLCKAGLRQGHLERARSHAQDGRAIESLAYSGVPQFNLKFVYFALHFEAEEYAQAQACLAQARDLPISAKTTRALAVDLGAEFILLETGRSAEAVTLLSADALDFRFDSDFSDFYVQLHAYRLRLHAQRGDASQARASLSRALRAIRRSGNRLWASWLAGSLAGLAADRSERDLARRCLWHAQRLQRDAGIVPSPRQRASWQRVREVVELSPLAHGARSAAEAASPPALGLLLDMLDAWGCELLATPELVSAPRRCLRPRAGHRQRRAAPAISVDQPGGK